jgi:hypothetical protein
MSVIFQLFRADDLKMLSTDQLNELKKKINVALEDAQQELQSHTGSSEDASQQKLPSEETPPGTLRLKISPKEKTPEPLRLKISSNPDPSTTIPPQIRAALNRAIDKRFHEVSQQLKSAQPRSASNFKARLNRIHLNQPDPEEQEKEKTILEWALSCEVNNFEFYYPLWHAKNVAYDFFLRKTGQEPKGPDSPYSPFNRDHPFSKFFYDLR